MVLGSAKQVQVHPLVSEARFQRKALAELLSRLGLPDNDDEDHDPKLRRREANQEIAHYTGAQDNYSVVALLMPPPQPRALAGVAVMNIGLGTPTDERVRQLGSLCQGLIEGLDARFKALGDQFQAFVNAQNLDDLYDDPTRINNKVQ